MINMFLFTQFLLLVVEQGGGAGVRQGPPLAGRGVLPRQGRRQGLRPGDQILLEGGSPGR